MGKEEKNPEKKKMTNMDYGNIIIKYANESGGIDKEELILAGKLLGRGLKWTPSQGQFFKRSYSISLISHSHPLQRCIHCNQ